MNTLAQLKRELTVGTVLTMTRHDWFPNGKLIGKQRKVIRTQTNGIWMESETSSHGSFLEFKKASEVRVHDKGFEIRIDPIKDKWMCYSMERVNQ